MWVRYLFSLKFIFVCFFKHNATGSSSEKIKIDGTCEKQYEPVKEHLLEMLTKGKEENVQLCVYVNGNCVVDLYGTAVGDANYNHDKLQV